MRSSLPAVSGRDAADDHLFHVHAGPGARARPRWRSTRCRAMSSRNCSARSTSSASARVRTVREVADRVHESAAGIVDIHANDAVKLQLTDLPTCSARIYDIRFEIYQRKFFVKFLNNFIAQLTPFFFYSIGGYLVIRGNLSFGALVAVLAAYKDLASPWKELLDFYQSKEDSRIKYEQIVEQFQPAGMADARLQMAEPEALAPLAGDLVGPTCRSPRTTAAASSTGSASRSRSTEHVAVIGQGGSGKNELALLLARLVRPTSGRITIGGPDIADPAGRGDRPPDRLCRRDALSVRRHSARQSAVRAASPFRCGRPTYERAVARRRAKTAHEARHSGNIDFDLHADWIDYAGAGVRKRRGIVAAHHRGADAARFRRGQSTRFGLRWRLDPAAHPEACRRGFSKRAERSPARLAEDGIANLVETYDPERFNTNASVAENLLFGTPIGPAFDFDALADNNYVLEVLDKIGPDRGPRRGRPAGRRDDDRVVRRPAARSRILRAVQLYQREGSARFRRHPRPDRAGRRPGSRPGRPRASSCRCRSS